VPHPDGLPDLFLDRSLGRVVVPRLLREQGLRLLTLSEYYGIPADEEITDETWLEAAGQAGWAVFMKDARIRYNRIEQRAVREFGVRCFCLSNQSLSGAEMAARFMSNLRSIVAACETSGPFIYAVHKTRIELLDLP